MDINKDKIKKPVGIYLIGYLVLILELYSIIVYFWIIGYKTHIVYNTVTIAVLAKVILGIAASIGLLKFKIWGRTFMLLFCIINLIDIGINKVMSLFYPQVISRDIHLFHLILSIGIIAYLLRPRIRTIFKELA